MTGTQNNELPLVSVCVITYNSSATVLETLESVLEQTYPRLELIVSDDCSKDDTVSICSSWLKLHKDRFERVDILVRESNGGVAVNLNMAIRATEGEWVKTIAGDDLLMPDCIKDNIDFVSKHENSDIVFSVMRSFKVVDNERILTEDFRPQIESMSFYSFPAEKQYQLLLSSGDYVAGTTVFQRRIFALSHLFPEEYSYCEDWPLWTRLTKTGTPLLFFNKVTVLYRYSDSLSHAPRKTYVNELFHHSIMTFFYSERYIPLKKDNPALAIKQQKEFFLGDFAILLLGNRRNLFTRSIMLFFKLILKTRKLH